MNYEDPDDDRYSMATIGDIFTDALKPYAEEDRRIFETNSPKWVADVERMLTSRNEKKAAAAFRGFLDTDGGMQKMRETLVRFSSRHKKMVAAEGSSALAGRVEGSFHNDFRHQTACDSAFDGALSLQCGYG